MKQNLLFIFADQMHRYALGCMGTPDILTPNLDRLASQGTLFRNAYSNCPICTPFRISLCTGLYSSTTDTLGNEARIPEGIPTLAGDLNRAGFRTSWVGKWHIGGAGNIPVPPELRGDFTDFIGYQCYNGFRDNVVFFDEAGDAHPFDRHRTEVTTDLSIERLRGLADDPFALFVSYQAPHYPVQPAEEYAALYENVEIQRRPSCRDMDPYTPTFSPFSPRPPDTCPDYQRYGNNLSEYLRLYYAMVTQIDANVGRLLNELEALGLAENTVVIFTADHGDMQGSHGLKNKCLPQEESSGIPLIVRAPGGARGQVSDALIDSVSFLPTCLAFAGAEASAERPGFDFSPVVMGEEMELNGPVYSEFHGWQMIRQGEWKLVANDTGERPPTQLYNLADDPFELNNCVADPNCHELRSRLLDRLYRQFQPRPEPKG